MTRSLVVLALAAGCGNAEAPPDAPPTVDLMRGCALKAAMDEASWAGPGHPVLNSCGSNAGSITGATATTVMSDRGRVGQFSGNACVDFASADSLHGTTGLTMSAWIKPTALNGVDSNGVIAKRNDKNEKSEYGLFVWTGNKVWIDLGDSDRYSGTATLNNGQWSHLTAVFDASQASSDRVRLFINGVPDPLDHAVIGTLGSTLPAYDSPLHLGCTPAPKSNTQQTFQGQLDDVTIWSRALTTDEIAALYAKG